MAYRTEWQPNFAITTEFSEVGQEFTANSSPLAGVGTLVNTAGGTCSRRVRTEIRQHLRKKQRGWSHAATCPCFPDGNRTGGHRGRKPEQYDPHRRNSRGDSRLCWGPRYSIFHRK